MTLGYNLCKISKNLLSSVRPFCEMAKYGVKLLYFEWLKNYLLLRIAYVVSHKTNGVYLLILLWTDCVVTVVKFSQAHKLLAVVADINMPLVDKTTMQMFISRCNLDV